MADPRPPHLTGRPRLGGATMTVGVLATGWLVCASAQSPQSTPAAHPGAAAHPAPHAAARSSGAMTMDQAVKMAEQRFKARVVRAESRRDGVRTIYVLRLLNDHGRVWTVRINSANGSVL